VWKRSGDIIIKEKIEGAPSDAETLGLALAERLLSRGGEERYSTKSMPGTDGNGAPKITEI